MPRHLIPILMGCLLVSSVPSHAQSADAPDTLTYELPEIEVQALRGNDRLRDIPAASFVIPRSRIRQMGDSRVSNLLSTLPGLFAYQQNSNGDFKSVDARGFATNGVTSYLKLLVDGQDVRDLENGNLDWDWLLPDDVERLEVVEGAGSWAYGDAAEGGIVNIVRPGIRPGLHSDCAVRAGSFGFWAGSVVLGGAQSNGWSGSARGSARGVDGWRDRSRERVYVPGGEVRWTPSERTRVSLTASYLDADRQDPGSLTADQVRDERTQSETTTDFQHAKTLLVGARLAQGDPKAREWSLSPYVRNEDVDLVSTLLFQTQSHRTDGITGGAELGFRDDYTIAGHGVSLVAGGLYEHGRLRSKYHEFLTGALETDNESRRQTGALFANARVALDEATSVRVGFREDAVQVESDSLMEGIEVEPHTFWSASPFVALSRRLGENASAYVSYGTAFHVPTLSQLYDRRPFFTPFPPFVSYLSNAGLQPQRANNFEIGARADAASGAYAMLTLYDIRVKDEIDFDAGTLQYGNISKSWHRGIQAAIQQPITDAFAVNASATLSPTTIDGGPNDGNQINAVPERTAYGALSWAGSAWWSLEAGARYVGRQFLDKENQHPLGEFTTGELTGGLKFSRVHATVKVLNLFDRKYSDTGFMTFDQSFLPQERFFPAAGRSFTIAITAD
jgi:outer membrane receptor protein involved in Fe transport